MGNNKKLSKVRRYTGSGHLLIRLLVLGLIALSVVVYTDKKRYFITDQSDPHHEQRWDDLYEVTGKCPIDIVILGNSHANTGVDPFNLSCTLGCTAFDMAPSGVTIADAYYCLKELLTRTTPRLVVIETYLMRGTEGPSVEGASLADQYRSFYPRRNRRIKLGSLPVLFGVESYLPAWSFTLRNHELFLRNRKEMEKNMDLYEKRHSSKEKRLYLGRYSRFTSGISDSIMSMYETKGAAVEGRDEKISKRDIKYARKIVDLCDEKGIEVMFLTLPMYEQHIANYDHWYEEQKRAIIPTGKAWYNLQMPYLTSVFDRECFESTYDMNQHMTIVGSIKATYGLAHFIADELKTDLPDRRNESSWLELFYGKDGYYENMPPRNDDSNYRIIAQDVMLEDIHIIECLQENDDWFFLKLDRDSDIPDRVSLIVEANVNGQIMTGSVESTMSRVYTPVHHKLYVTRLQDNVTITKLVGWENNIVIETN